MTAGHATTLADVVTEIRNGIDLDQHDIPTGEATWPISRIETIAEARIDFTRVKYAAPSPDEAERYKLKQDDILFSHINSPKHIGKTALFTGEKPLLHGINLLLLRFDRKRCEPAYFDWQLKSSPIRAHFRTRCKKAVNQASLNQGDILSLPIRIPDLPEQKRIAGLLEQADRLRRTRRYALELSDTFLPAAFLQLFGDPKKNPKGWPHELLSDVCLRFADGPFGSNLKTEHYRPSGVRVIRLNNIGVGEFVENDGAFISPEHFETLRKHECLPGDVLIGTLGDPNLRACIQPPQLKQALNKADCVQARPNPKKAIAEYLSALLNIPSTLYLIPGMVHGQTRSRVSMGELAELPIPVPPLPLQHHFAALVAQHERLRANQREALWQAEHLFQSLLHRAFAM